MGESIMTFEHIIWALLACCFFSLGLVMYLLVENSKLDDKITNLTSHNIWSIAQATAYRNLNREHRLLREAHDELLIGRMSTGTHILGKLKDADDYSDIVDLTPEPLTFDMSNDQLEGEYPHAYGANGFASPPPIRR